MYMHSNLHVQRQEKLRHYGTGIQLHSARCTFYTPNKVAIFFLLYAYPARCVCCHLNTSNKVESYGLWNILWLYFYTREALHALY
jgi:hypothetical protein